MWIFRSEPWQFSNEKTRLLALFGGRIRTRGAQALREALPYAALRCSDSAGTGGRGIAGSSSVDSSDRVQN